MTYILIIGLVVVVITLFVVVCRRGVEIRELEVSLWNEREEHRAVITFFGGQDHIDSLMVEPLQGRNEVYAGLLKVQQLLSRLDKRPGFMEFPGVTSSPKGIRAVRFYELDHLEMVELLMDTKCDLDTIEPGYHLAVSFRWRETEFMMFPSINTLLFKIADRRDEGWSIAELANNQGVADAIYGDYKGGVPR